MIYRKFKCTEERKDEDSGKLYSVRRTLNLYDIATYAENEGKGLDDSVKRTDIWIGMNPNTITIRMDYFDFDKVHEESRFHAGILDSRSTKKKTNYSGMADIFFMSERKEILMTAYPKGFNFENKPPDVIYDALLGSLLTPMN